jgi:hypothetical protein
VHAVYPSQLRFRQLSRLFSAPFHRTFQIKRFSGLSPQHTLTAAHPAGEILEDGESSVGVAVDVPERGSLFFPEAVVWVQESLC